MYCHETNILSVIKQGWKSKIKTESKVTCLNIREVQATAYKVGKAGFKSQTSKNKTESKGTSPRNREVWATAMKKES